MDKKEARIQQEIYMWFHNNKPEMRGLLCYNLNNSKNKIDGARNKALGLQKGRSDMVLYRKGTAIMIEIKTPTGMQSDSQKQWQKKIEAEGFRYEIIKTLDDFIELL